ncbi:MAG: AtpZ/AtpI family protein [Pseudobdellovibrionaceae bacterium]
MDNNIEDLKGRIDALKKETLPARPESNAQNELSSDSNLGSAYELIATPLVCGGMGMGLDYLFSTKPVFFMTLGILGLCAAFWRIYKNAHGIVSPLDSKGLRTREKTAKKSAISEETQEN